MFNKSSIFSFLVGLVLLVMGFVKNNSTLITIGFVFFFVAYTYTSFWKDKKEEEKKKKREEVEKKLEMEKKQENVKFIEKDDPDWK